MFERIKTRNITRGKIRFSVTRPQLSVLTTEVQIKIKALSCFNSNYSCRQGESEDFKQQANQGEADQTERFPNLMDLFH